MLRSLLPLPLLLQMLLLLLVPPLLLMLLLLLLRCSLREHLLLRPPKPARADGLTLAAAHARGQFGLAALRALASALLAHTKRVLHPRKRHFLGQKLLLHPLQLLLCGRERGTHGGQDGLKLELALTCGFQCPSAPRGGDDSGVAPVEYVLQGIAKPRQAER